MRLTPSGYHLGQLSYPTFLKRVYKTMRTIDRFALYILIGSVIVSVIGGAWAIALYASIALFSLVEAHIYRYTMDNMKKFISDWSDTIRIEALKADDPSNFTFTDIRGYDVSVRIDPIQRSRRN